MNSIGHAVLHKELVHTTGWPSGLLGEQYKKALTSEPVTVLEISEADGSYLVLGNSIDTGPIIWMIEPEDVRAFVPVIKKHGILMPAGLSPLEEFEYLMKNSGLNHETNSNHE